VGREGPEPRPSALLIGLVLGYALLQPVEQVKSCCSQGPARFLLAQAFGKSSQGDRRQVPVEVLGDAAGGSLCDLVNHGWGATGWFGGFGGIRQPCPLADARGHSRGCHLGEQPPHQGGSLQGLGLAQVAPEDATGLLHTPEGVDRPQTAGFKKVRDAHQIGLSAQDRLACMPTLYLTDQVHK
jgi:hypothetical protein